MHTCLRSIVVVFVLAACSSSPAEVPGTQIRMDFARPSFFAAPFPSDDLQNPDGTIRMANFPNPDAIDFVQATLDVIRTDVRGFGLSAGVFFPLTGPIATNNLPGIFTSTREDAKVFLIGVSPGEPDYLTRYPVDVTFTADGGPFGAPNLLSLVPLQGVPLRPKTRYAAVVLRSVGDVDGEPLGVSPQLYDLVRGRSPRHMRRATYEIYRDALSALTDTGVRFIDLAGLAVFTTGDPAAQMGEFLESALALPRPKPERAFSKNETFPEFCVYESTIKMPVYQTGKPPFSAEGGAWAVDEAGNPVLQGYEEANFVVTLPRQPMPGAGFPTAVFIRTGGGGERPLADRGIRDASGAVITPGTGPAQELARVGFAGVSIDGPHGGLRNVTHGDEQLLMFNFLNPPAMRDNVRQAALETILTAHILPQLSIDMTDCPGASGGPARFDTTKLALMGHSMGATVAQPALAYEPSYKALILSGAGASWLENIIFKKKPLDVKAIAENLLLNYGKYGRELHRHDPAVSLVQWAGEPSDAPAYNRLVTKRHVLMLQGIVDHYILPPIANTTSLSLGLDLAGGAVDAATGELAPFDPLATLLAFAGGKELAYPVEGNRGGRTAVVVQHREDGVEDGHEVMFQLEGPKVQYRCFLETFAATGKPVVVDPAADSCS